MGGLEHREGEPWRWQMVLRGSLRIKDGSLTLGLDSWTVGRRGRLVRRGWCRESGGRRRPGGGESSSRPCTGDSYSSSTGEGHLGKGAPQAPAWHSAPPQELSASHEPGCVGGCSLGAWPGVSSLCLMDKALPAEWFGWEWAAPALGAERPEGSAPKPGLDGPEGALLRHIGIPLPLAEPWVSLPCLVPNWIDFLL